jgi:hypothetical protein
MPDSALYAHSSPGRDPIPNHLVEPDSGFTRHELSCHVPEPIEGKQDIDPL